RFIAFCFSESVSVSHFSHTRSSSFPAMSQQLDALLDHLNRYQERLYVTGDRIKHQLSQLVDQRIEALSKDVTQLRNRILCGWARDLQLANDSVSDGKTVDCKEYHATRARNQDNAAPSLDDSISTPSTSRKRTRRNQQQSVAKRQKTSSDADNRDDEES